MGEGPREEFGLVKASPEPSAPMQGDGDDHVETLVKRDRAQQQVAQRPRQRFDAGVLE